VNKQAVVAVEVISDFVGKFEMIEMGDVKKFFDGLKGQGYTHCLIVNASNRLVGCLDWEFRLLFSVVFFKGNPPDFHRLCAGTGEGDVILYERRKFYSEMTSIGRGSFKASLTRAELSEWINFFSGQLKEIQSLDDFLKG
jgi:hypothetical protein